MGVSFDGHSNRSSMAEVGYFEDTFTINKNVVRFKVSVYNSFTVAVLDSKQYLISVALKFTIRQNTSTV